MNWFLKLAATTTMALTIAGCETGSTNPVKMDMGDKVAIATLAPAKSAATMPANQNVMGTITFTEHKGSVRISADLTGLAPDTVHGFHIHEKGDLSAADLMSTGGHFNPDHQDHGAPTDMQHHAGDFGNVTSDATGHAHLELTVNDLTIGGEKNDILGKAVIVHAKPDDLKSQPSGNAGARVAGGVIELKK